MVPQNPDSDCVAQRGTAVLNARGASSAANAAIDHFGYTGPMAAGFQWVSPTNGDYGRCFFVRAWRPFLRPDLHRHVVECLVCMQAVAAILFRLRAWIVVSAASGA
jgi:hypothetical protein